MKKTIKPEEFCDTFTPGLTGHKRTANNDWSIQMHNMLDTGGLCASPDGQYPQLTKTEDGWEYEEFEDIANAVTPDISRFLIFGTVVGDKILWEGRKSLDKAQRTFLHSATKALREVITAEPDKFTTGGFAVVMYNNPEDFVGQVLSGLSGSVDETKASYQEIFDR